MTAEVRLIKQPALSMQPSEFRTVTIAEIKAGRVEARIERYTECVSEGRYFVNNCAQIDVRDDVGVGMAQVHVDQENWQALLDLAAVATACASILKPLEIVNAVNGAT
jgi:hypothetical protein